MSLKILHVIPYYAPAWNFGGPVRAAADLCREQYRCGHTVSVLTLNWDGKKPIFNSPRPVVKKISGVNVHYLPTASKLRGVYFYSPFLPRYWSVVDDVDLVHVHTLFNFFTAATFFHFKERRTPLVINPHGMILPPALSVSPFRKKIHRFFVENHLLKRADKVFFTTPQEMDESVFPQGSSTIVMPLGLPIPLKVSPPLFRQGPRRMVFIGRIHPIKGLPLFLGSLQRLGKDAEWTLDLWGPDEENHRIELNALIHRLNLQGRISFQGSFEHSRIKSILSRYDLAVLPSIQENFGMSAAEALLSRIPVFVSQNVQLATLIKKSRCGWVANRNLTDFTRVLIEILKTPRSGYRTMGNRGAEMIQKNFSLEITAEKTIALYETLIAKNKSPDNGEVVRR